MHLMLDARGGDSAALGHTATAESYLATLAERTDMTIIVPPMVKGTPIGLVGMVVLAESHASIHVVDDNAWVDLFTCRPMSEEVAVDLREYTRELYTFREIRGYLMHRGLDTLESAPA